MIDHHQSKTFTRLTRLHIASPTETLYQFSLIAQHVPGLVELTLGSHYTSCEDDDPYIPCMELKFPMFYQLRKFTAVGGNNTLREIFSTIIPLCPTLHFMVLYALPFDYRSLEYAFEGLDRVSQLQGLAFYGGTAEPFLEYLSRDGFREDDEWTEHPLLRVLCIEAEVKPPFGRLVFALLSYTRDDEFFNRVSIRRDVQIF